MDKELKMRRKVALFMFVCILFLSSFFFSLKICQIKEQIGQGVNVCKMEGSLGQEKTE